MAELNESNTVNASKCKRFRPVEVHFVNGEVMCGSVESTSVQKFEESKKSGVLVVVGDSMNHINGKVMINFGQVNYVIVQ